MSDLDTPIGPSSAGTEQGSGPAATQRRLLRLSRLADSPVSENGPGALESFIDDEDDWLSVPHPALAPWRRICSITAKNGADWTHGTGWLVGPKTIITAGHIVYSQRDLKGFATNVEVIPARNGVHAPFGVFTTDRVQTIAGWKASEEPRYDYGAIFLPEPVDASIGAFSFAALTDEALQGLTVHISGYPLVEDGGPDGTFQWTHTRTILAVTERRIFYDMDTAIGHSGAPVWAYLDGEYRVVGIHAYGTNRTPLELEIEANSGTRITDRVAETIHGWIAAS